MTALSLLLQPTAGRPKLTYFNVPGRVAGELLAILRLSACLLAAEGLRYTEIDAHTYSQQRPFSCCVHQDSSP